MIQDVAIAWGELSPQSALAMRPLLFQHAPLSRHVFTVLSYHLSAHLEIFKNSRAALYFIVRNLILFVSSLLFQGAVLITLGSNFNVHLASILAPFALHFALQFCMPFFSAVLELWGTVWSCWGKGWRHGRRHWRPCLSSCKSWARDLARPAAIAWRGG